VGHDISSVLIEFNGLMQHSAICLRHPLITVYFQNGLQIIDERIGRIKVGGVTVWQKILLEPVGISEMQLVGACRRQAPSPVKIKDLMGCAIRG
jgi:hypothetical protein